MMTFDEISSEDLDRSYIIGNLKLCSVVLHVLISRLLESADHSLLFVFSLDVMGQIVRLGNIEDVTAQGKISRRLRLDLRDTRLDILNFIF